jgi:hypothetical protein
MIDKHHLSVILTAAYPPVQTRAQDTKPQAARSIKGALRELDHQTDLLLIDARMRYPLHDTLQEVVERMR